MPSLDDGHEPGIDSAIGGSCMTGMIERDGARDTVEDFVAVAGTGMGSVAGLFQSLGHDVSGSDTAFYPPMGPALRRWGIRLLEGCDPKHLEPRPDLVVIGNVCRPWNVEARAAIERGTYAAYARAKLAAIDRHEHSDQPLGRAAEPAVAVAAR